MKKLAFITTIFCFFFTGISYAQLKIETDGKAIFGNNKTFSNGLSIYDEASSANTPFRLYKKNDDNVYLTRGNELKGMRFNPNGRFYLGENGFMASSWTGLLNLYVNSSVGMVIMQRTNSTALHIDANGANSTIIDVNGPLAQDQPFLLKGNGSLTLGVNGEFRIKKSSSSVTRFLVDVNGGVYANGSIVLTSDAQLKKNIETIQSPLSKILQLRGVTYDWISPEEEAKLCNIPQEEIDKQLSYDKASQEETDKNISPEVKRKIAEEKKRKVIGVVAQEVEKVVPEVVKTYENGLMGVAYDQLIGLLIEGIKEQQDQITELTKKVEFLEENKVVFPEVTLRSTTDNATIGSELPATLHQNIPNPFSESTKIGYNLPNNIQTAYLCVYDMQGKQVKRFTLTERGENFLTIEGYELTAGMYLYALIADGQEVDVKRMILTE